MPRWMPLISNLLAVFSHLSSFPESLTAFYWSCSRETKNSSVVLLFLFFLSSQKKKKRKKKEGIFSFCFSLVSESSWFFYLEILYFLFLFSLSVRFSSAVSDVAAVAAANVDVHDEYGCDG